jgi:hypothetical protein
MSSTGGEVISIRLLEVVKDPMMHNGGTPTFAIIFRHNNESHLHDGEELIRTTESLRTTAQHTEKTTRDQVMILVGLCSMADYR